MAIRIFVLCLALGWAIAEIEDQEKSESESNPQVIQPLTFGSAVVAEAHRLQSIHDVFPPPGMSHYKPYGERTILAIKFPSIPKDISSHHDSKSSDSYKSDHYGSPNPEYLIPTEKPINSQGELGVIVSQNHIFRENVRLVEDIHEVHTMNQGRPSNELVIELAKEFGRKNRKSFNSFSPYQSSNPQNPSYVIIAIESRLKTNPNSGLFSFVSGESLTNGTIIFPSPKGSSLTNIPFTLRYSEDIHHVFDGYEKDAEQLIPKEKTEIKHFLKLLHELHENIHKEGKEVIARLRRDGDEIQTSSSRLPGTEVFSNYDNSLAEDDLKARLTNWLYTSTVGLRTLSPSYEHTLEYPSKSVNEPILFYPVESIPVISK